MDNELIQLFGQLSRAIDARENQRSAAEAHERRFNELARMGESLASEMPGFNPERDPALSPVDAHTGEAHFFINGFAGMPVKFVNPRKSGVSAEAAFRAGAAKRREMGL